MKQVEFVDQTLRDGQQSHWGIRMRAFEAAGALEPLAKTGFRTIDLTGPGQFTVLTREFNDDPWDTVDFLVKGLRGNDIRAGMRTHSVMGFARAPESIIDLWVKTLIKHGITSFWIYDCAYDMQIMKRLFDVILNEGATPVPSIMYGLTSVHDDEFFARHASMMASWPGIRSIYVEDAPGILKPERAITLIPALRDAAGSVPLEMHFHNSTGLAPYNYMIGMQAGLNIIHTASRPLANGVSLPSTESMLEVVKHLGLAHGLDVGCLAPVESHFEQVARAGRHPVGAPVEFDPGIYDHQLPGGATGTLINQLDKYGMRERLPEVLAEIPQVRRDLGEPIMATPFSQFVGIQAVLNIIIGKRYEVAPDEVIHYLLGHYGPIVGPVNEAVRDRILTTPRAQELAQWEPPNSSLSEIRKSFPKGISDEELLLRYMNSADEVDRTLANGPVRKDPRRATSEIGANIVDLIWEQVGQRQYSLNSPQMSLILSKGGN